MTQNPEPEDLYMKQVFDHSDSFVRPLFDDVTPEIITQAQYDEARMVLRDRKSRGLKPLGEYTEHISPNAFDKVETDYVPLTMYVNGDRREIGTAGIEFKPEGIMVTGHIYKIEGDELKDVIAKNTLNGVSFGFHLNSFRGNYPGSRDIALYSKNDSTPATED